MKITVRIPTEMYAYQELEFDSIKEYNELLPEFMKAYINMKKTVKQVQKNNEVPFEN